MVPVNCRKQAITRFDPETGEGPVNGGMAIFRQSSAEFKENGVFVVCGVITQGNSVTDFHLSWVGRIEPMPAGARVVSTLRRIAVHDLFPRARSIPVYSVNGSFRPGPLSTAFQMLVSQILVQPSLDCDSKWMKKSRKPVLPRQKGTSHSNLQIRSLVYRTTVTEPKPYLSLTGHYTF